MRFLIALIFILSYQVSNATITVAGTNSAPTNTSIEKQSNRNSLSAKKKAKILKKVNRLKKRLKKKKSPGLWSVLTGLGSLALIVFTIAASFALSSTWAALGLIAAALFGIGGLVFGFRALRNGQKLGGWLGIITGALGFLAVLAMIIGALSR